MPVNHDLFDLTPFAKHNLLLIPSRRKDLQEIGMERILCLDGEEPTAVCGLGGGPHLWSFLQDEIVELGGGIFSISSEMLI